MPRYRLLAPNDVMSEFARYCGRPKLSTNDLPLNLFEWEAAHAHHDLIELIHQENYRQRTCVFWEVRAYQAIFFDMDSTVITQESIVELARFANTSEAVHDITEKAMAGELDFDQALRARVATLKGQPLGILDQVGERLELSPGIGEFCQIARSRNLELYLISGGFNELAAKIASQLHFHGYRANQLTYQDGYLTGEVTDPIINGEAKFQYIQRICQEKGFRPSHIIAIGDGANDLKMLKYAGLSIGFRPKEIVIPQVNGSIFDPYTVLKEILIDT